MNTTRAWFSSDTKLVSGQPNSVQNETYIRGNNNKKNRMTHFFGADQCRIVKLFRRSEGFPTDPANGGLRFSGPPLSCVSELRSAVSVEQCLKGRVSFPRGASSLEALVARQETRKALPRCREGECWMRFSGRTQQIARKAGRVFRDLAAS